MKTLRYILVFGVLCGTFSCKHSTKEHISDLVAEWDGKEIRFPDKSVFTIQGIDTVDFSYVDSEYKIVTYVDSTGCVSCKLQLSRWKQLVEEVDTIVNARMPFLFYFYPKDEKELCYILRRDAFTYPVCIDREGCFDALNHFPSDMTFQTFLLDKENRVKAIGNPVLNPKVKELYIRLLTGMDKQKTQGVETEVKIDRQMVDFGDFPFGDAQTGTFTIANVGEKPLVIQDVITSCGCVAVEYDKSPVKVGNSVQLRVKYQADHFGYFNKSITVYCNGKGSPFHLTVCGVAKK